MRHTSMPDRSVWAKIRPKDNTDRHRIRVVGSYLAFTVAFLALSTFFKHRHRENVQQTWQSATAVIEDVRTKEAVLVNSVVGGSMLYDVAVLAKYKTNSIVQERWITVEQMPRSLAEARMQAFRWKVNPALFVGSLAIPTE
jgi:hypothetical protein